MTVHPTLSHAQGPTTPLSDLTIPQRLTEIATRLPDQEALVIPHQNIRLTWREFRTQVERVAGGLIGLGLAPGDHVGIWASNCVEWVLQYATARARLVLVNVNPAYRSRDLGYILSKSRMRALFLRESDARANYREILEEAKAGQTLPLKQTIWLV